MLNVSLWVNVCLLIHLSAISYILHICTFSHFICLAWPPLHPSAPMIWFSKRDYIFVCLKGVLLISCHFLPLFLYTHPTSHINYLCIKVNRRNITISWGFACSCWEDFAFLIFYSNIYHLLINWEPQLKTGIIYIHEKRPY